ncbi:gag-pol polyprotein [Pseudoloma neurophilia]|uniref:Gag-pol polyprotein n=1 Tax=Pseudoloma neurophilia TaxID=146866 RepID=A0A0R0LYT7_9MICR|nr:gag-pol polyprotein [Pseudoloma neurophilia]
MGKFCLMVLSFNWQKSIQKRFDPSGFDTSTTGERNFESAISILPVASNFSTSQLTKSRSFVVFCTVYYAQISPDQSN